MPALLDLERLPVDPPSVLRPPVPRPPVLIVGGLLTSPAFYWHMRARLLRRGAGSVDIAPVYTPDWLLLVRLGYGRLVRRVGRAVVRTYRGSGRRPVLLVGHSAGGVLARLAMSPAPFRGYLAGIAEGVGALVTLGSPLHSAPDGDPRLRAAREVTTFLDEMTPGAFFAPRTGYVTVAGSYTRGAASNDPDRRRRAAGEAYARVMGEAARQGEGDGLIPVAAAHLDGAIQLTLPGIVHAQAMRAPWYGDDPALDLWWPVALEAYRAALEARAG
jgi:hypothetical protein